MTTRTTHAFSTPIYFDPAAAGAEAPSLNAALVGAIRDLAAKNPSDDAFRAHRGGFYSPGAFFESGLPGVDGVKQVIGAGVRNYLTDIGVGQTVERVDMLGWVALTRAGDYQTPHVHAGSTISGVYYASMPDAPDPEGCIDFITPVSAQEMSFLKGVSRSFCRIRPTEGGLVIFPSYLRHFTHPFTNPAERICVAFNAGIRQRRG